MSTRGTKKNSSGEAAGLYYFEYKFLGTDTHMLWGSSRGLVPHNDVCSNKLRTVLEA